jgi:hypothetical protein
VILVENRGFIFNFQLERKGLVVCFLSVPFLSGCVCSGVEYCR